MTTEAMGIFTAGILKYSVWEDMTTVHGYGSMKTREKHMTTVHGSLHVCLLLDLYLIFVVQSKALKKFRNENKCITRSCFGCMFYESQSNFIGWWG